MSTKCDCLAASNGKCVYAGLVFPRYCVMCGKQELPTAELDRQQEIQHTAEICGNLSLGAYGPVAYSATYEIPGQPPKITAIEPSKVEGIYENIWVRLKNNPDYKPLEAEKQKTAQAMDWYVAKAKQYDALLNMVKELLPAAKTVNTRLKQQMTTHTRDIARLDKLLTASSELIAKEK